MGLRRMTGTEELADKSLGIDQRDDAAILALLAEGQLRAVRAVQAASAQIARAAGALAGRLSDGGRLIYAGAGSSIGIAVQDGAELPGTFGLERSRLVFLIAGGERSLIDINAAAEDDSAAAEQAVAATACTPKDSLIAVSASGRTPYTLAAARRAREQGTLIIAIANTASSPLLLAADCPILLESGPEIIAGSTRLGAGTAQKSALGLLSTLTHVKLGGVMDGMMVNVRADNAKLIERATGIIARIARVDETKAARALEAAGGEVKAATLLCAGASSLSAAQSLLAAARGNLRLALDDLAGPQSAAKHVARGW